MAMGASPDVIESTKKQASGETDIDCEIWPENEEVFMLFNSLSTQWRISFSGSFIGINYPSIESSMNMLGTKKKRRAELFNDIKTMERAALPILNRKKD
ncbi:DUF1799 domain-containing protein [Nitrosomonas communis]|uniref:Uncharacterized protein n=1 Tax=Nitrosomonas communis TaxID=44574 RepID=A0A1I4UVE4_9PROT|nr:DUF1799 domain-containing protein [Nitrosomonas communis]SFM92942.1 Phage related hypothetical protein [Nitrosomonas communis]